jgi:LPXTG-motif cell wall-anchored protein
VRFAEAAMDPQALPDILGYKRQVLEQLLTVASVFGGFAVTGVIALRADERRDRVHAPLQTLLSTGDSVAWAVLAGAAGLIAALGLLGFARSRRMGVFVLLLALLAAVAFLLNVWALARLS